MEENKEAMEFLRDEKEGNKIKYLIPPFADLDVNELGKRRFLNCYLNKERSLVFVHLKDVTRKVYLYITSRSNYKYIAEVEKVEFYVFDIFEYRKPDLDLLFEGKLTQISEYMKKEIYTLSGLRYNAIAKTGFVSSDYLLQAFEVHSPLRQSIAYYLGVKTKDMPAELVRAIPDEAPCYIENYLKGEQ